MERIDDQIFRIGQAAPRAAAQQEVSGKVDPFDRQPGAPRHLDVEQRQRDRNAGAAVEHGVEEAVARVLVVGLVAGELQLFEEIRVERDHLGVALGVHVVRRVGRRFGAREPARRFPAEVVEPIEVAAGVELGIFHAGDHQRRDREVRVRAERDMAECSQELRRDHDNW